ncbi:MAG: hypothetical protein QOH09_1075 [Pseudonocardiales bacterium]|jgi:hypothetical protein|nr:hypothetical protein [Pseudonocardiales bacterium]
MVEDKVRQPCVGAKITAAAFRLRFTLSRVSSYENLLSYISLPIGQLCVGPLAHTLGGFRVALAAGILYAVAAVALLASSAVRGLPHNMATRGKYEHHAWPAARIVGSHPHWSCRMIAEATGLAVGTVAEIRKRSTEQNGAWPPHCLVDVFAVPPNPPVQLTTRAASILKLKASWTHHPLPEYGHASAG